MTILQFYEGIGLDDGAKRAALSLEKRFSPETAAPVFDLLMQPAMREEGLAALRAAAGEDADGMTAFVLMAHCAAERTFAAYAARLASKAASIACTRKGAAASIPTREETLAY